MAVKEYPFYITATMILIGLYYLVTILNLLQGISPSNKKPCFRCKPSSPTLKILELYKSFKSLKNDLPW